MLHDLFTKGVNGKRHRGWILLLPTVTSQIMDSDCVIESYAV